MLLLRSILAPVLLVATTLLSYGTAMGVSAWVFNGIFNFPGADPSVPLFGFVFLVALGVDYNIFLMTRVREESLVHGTRAGVLRGLAVTGGVITSAGVVLAATFAALGIIPIMFLVQLGFIVAFGVLLDTLVVQVAAGPGPGARHRPESLVAEQAGTRKVTDLSFGGGPGTAKLGTCRSVRCGHSACNPRVYASTDWISRSAACFASLAGGARGRSMCA